MTVDIRIGDCLEVMATLPAASVDAVVTDPPYGIRFMGKAWDGADIKAMIERKKRKGTLGPDGFVRHDGAAFAAGTYDQSPTANRDFQEWSRLWAAEAYRLLKPGGHLLSFASTRTYHRMASGIEDAGFEIRDQIGWAYGSGFPKSLDVSKAIDKAAGVEREVVGKHHRHGGGSTVSGSMSGPLGTASVLPLTAPAILEAAAWQGWGTALKPAWEPICVARKPLIGTVAANVLAHGTGALNIDGCRVPTTDDLGGGNENLRPRPHTDGWDRPWMHDETHTAAHSAKVRGNVERAESLGRWPANLVHDGSDEVLAAFPEAPGAQRAVGPEFAPKVGTAVYGDYGPRLFVAPRGDSGSAARFFYAAKATKAERGEGNNHPTVKPIALMRWLVRLVTPSGGHVLDPFAGSGTTGIAASIEQFSATLIEMDAGYAEIARQRINREAPLFAAAAE